jgi:hypothetical protein
MHDIKYKNISSASSKILTLFIEKGKNWFSLSEAYTCFPKMTENQLSHNHR